MYNFYSLKSENPTFAPLSYPNYPLPTLLRHPDTPLQPEELDHYLTTGWRPTGQSMYTSDYLRTDDDAIYGCLQTRLPLANFVFKKRHRRLLKKNSEYFTFKISPAAFPDDEMLAINKKYMEVHPGKSQENLAFHVIGERLHKVLNTQVIRVFVAGKLIGFSYFDAGKQCLYSKAGIYDPKFKDYSLGIYTILLEIQWAKENGYAYYHPGYIAPQYPVFNYKLNFGPMEYRNPASRAWAPLESDPINHPDDPYRQCEDALLGLQTALIAAGISSELEEYPSYTARYYYANGDMDENKLLDAALLLNLQATNAFYSRVITYDLAAGMFRCYDTSFAGLRDFKLQETSPVNGRQRFPNPLRTDIEVATGKTYEEIVTALSD
jgi:arginine-tRNA-protein transferase